MIEILLAVSVIVNVFVIWYAIQLVKRFLDVSEELENLFNSLIIQGKPTKEYIEMLLLQRRWLWHHGTTEARALNILRTINEQLSN